MQHLTKLFENQLIINQQLWNENEVGKLNIVHAAGTSINVAFCEEIINSNTPFIMVVYK